MNKKNNSKSKCLIGKNHKWVCEKCGFQPRTEVVYLLIEKDSGIFIEAYSQKHHAKNEANDNQKIVKSKIIF